MNYMSNGKDDSFHSFNSWIDKKDVEWNSVECNSIV